ncbi:mandelate racemase/muconate lactonizing enzyme family protein [Streptomyces sp. NPDC048340]|uniref:mandelate racemase/muconate lactonizing enzyme family protein n=1 Tax=Streptomyces sp. NPDC048340 TaxID=3365537 RepID=UPI003712693D
MAEALLHHVTQPMRTGFDHPAARRRSSDSLLLRLSVDGHHGTGECAPRPYVTGETSRSVRAALELVDLGPLFARLRTTDPAELLGALHAAGFEQTFGITGGNNLLCLLETAVLDLLGRRLGTPAGALLPGRAGTTDGTTGGVGPAALPVSQVLDLGTDPQEFLDTRGPFHFVKIKASEDPARDVRTVAAVRDRLGESVPVMVDANMSWTPDTAAGLVGRLRDAGADLFEEPLPQRSWADLRELRRATGATVMLDESLSGPADAHTALRSGACDAFNVRVSKCGGLLCSARVVDFAREHGIAFQIGVQVAEVGPLINAGRALAFANPDALTVEAGQSDRFFDRMVVSPRPAVDRTANTISPVETPGFGLELDPSAGPYAVLAFTEGNRLWHPPTPDPRTKVRT